MPTEARSAKVGGHRQRAHITHTRRMVHRSSLRVGSASEGLQSRSWPPQLRFPFFMGRARTSEFPGILDGKSFALVRPVSKRFVYVLRNHDSPPKYYTGITSDVARRHAEHDAGACIHTAKHRPWSIDVLIEFADERRAVAFERYLKSGSGVAFAKRHLRWFARSR